MSIDFLLVIVPHNAATVVVMGANHVAGVNIILVVVFSEFGGKVRVSTKHWALTLLPIGSVRQ